MVDPECTDASPSPALCLLAGDLRSWRRCPQLAREACPPDRGGKQPQAGQVLAMRGVGSSQLTARIHRNGDASARNRRD